MIFNSKFNLGDIVWPVERQQMNTYKQCASCELGKIHLKDGATLDCPTCQGKGVLVNRSRMFWSVGRKLTVGQIRVEYPADKPEDAERVMCEETGIGSGTLHKVAELFATNEEAKRECDRLNKLPPGKEWVCPRCQPRYKKYEYHGYSEYQSCPVHGSIHHVDKDYAEGKLAEGSDQ